MRRLNRPRAARASVCARRRFPPVLVVSVTAPREVLAARLAARGREAADGIRARLDRAGDYRVEGGDVVVIDNAGKIEEAGEAMLRRLSDLRR